MSSEVSESLLSEFAEFVSGQMGLHFPVTRIGDLRKGIQLAAREFRFKDVTDCIRWLLSAPMAREQIEILASYLTVGETYFFREKRVFDALDEQVLPELIGRRRGSERRLRIWSAACCTGEEPYSIAISIRKALRDLDDWQVSILGTDINPNFLRRASAGVFSEWSFRDTPAGFRERHFIATDDGRWEIRPEIRRMVSFSHLNLVEDIYPSLFNGTNAVDLLFCRNVLIYFAPGPARRVVSSLCRCAAQDGWVVFGPNDVSQSALSGLKPVYFPGATLYKKDAARSSSAEDSIAREGGVSGGFEDLRIEDNVPSIELVLQTKWEASPSDAATIQEERPAPAPFEQALAFYEQGRYSETVAILVGLSSGDDFSDARVISLQAKTLANQGNLTEALACCDRLVAVDKLNPAVHYLRAVILQELASPVEAAAALKRVVYLDQDFVLAHFGLGNLARRNGNRVEANRYFGTALTLARAMRPEVILPEADGLTAGRLAEVINSMRETES